MAYAEKYKSKKHGTYYRVRYQAADGSRPTVGCDENGNRWRTRKAAEQWGEEKEARIRMGLDEESAPSVIEAARAARHGNSQTTLGEWANQWLPTQDLGVAAMANYRNHLELHILPHRSSEDYPMWEDTPVADIDAADVLDWERAMAADGIAQSSIRTYRATLYAMLADAVDAGLIEKNPCEKKRGRGRKSGKGGKGTRAPERPTVDPLGALLVAERAALLSGRDDEFVFVVVKAYTGMRFGELVGLQRDYVRPAENGRPPRIRVEWQLFELSGQWYHQPPKDDSYRDVDLPDFLARLLAEHMSVATPAETTVCPCLWENSPAPRHRGGVFVFRGTGQGRMIAQTGNVTITDVARAAEVSRSTVSNVLNGANVVADTTRARVEQVVAELGFTGAKRVSHAPAAHYRRGDVEKWVFAPATSGWYPAKTPQPARPVPVTAEPWPGVPVRGRGAANRAQGSWNPIRAGLTPHCLKHSHKTWMIEDRIGEILQHERLGHLMPGIGAVYSHITPAMRTDLLNALTRRWETSLRERATLHPHSPVPTLDGLLAPYREQPQRTRPTKIVSKKSPKNEEAPPSTEEGRASDLVGVAGFEPTASSSRRKPTINGHQEE